MLARAAGVELVGGKPADVAGLGLNWLRHVVLLWQFLREKIEGCSRVFQRAALGRCNFCLLLLGYQFGTSNYAILISFVLLGMGRLGA